MVGAVVADRPQRGGEAQEAPLSASPGHRPHGLHSGGPGGGLGLPHTLPSPAPRAPGIGGPETLTPCWPTKTTHSDCRDTAICVAQEAPPVPARGAPSPRAPDLASHRTPHQTPHSVLKLRAHLTNTNP